MVLRSEDGRRWLQWTPTGVRLCEGERACGGVLDIGCADGRFFRVSGTAVSAPGYLGDRTLYNLLRDQGFRMTRSQRRSVNRHTAPCRLVGGDAPVETGESVESEGEDAE